MPFPIVVPLEPSLYLLPFLRCLHPTGSLFWPFRVTCRHQSRDHLILKCLPIRVCISSHFPDNGPQIYWGYDLYLSRSHGIGHVTSRSSICHFLLVSHWNRVSIFNRFRDIWPQNQCSHTHTHPERKKDTRDTQQAILYSVTWNVLYCIGQTTC